VFPVCPKEVVNHHRAWIKETGGNVSGYQSTYGPNEGEQWYDSDMKRLAFLEQIEQDTQCCLR
jgi:hypothetical protein